MSTTRRASILALIVLTAFWIGFATATAHPGGTAADGCHYCRTNCASWGEVQDQRHCHGGSSDDEDDTSGGAAPPPPPPTDRTAPDQPRVRIADVVGARVTFAVSGEPGSRAQVRLGGTSIASATLGSGGTADVTFTLPDGGHRLEVTLRDAAGNESKLTAVAVDVDGTAPSAPAMRVNPAPTTSTWSTVRVNGEAGSELKLALTGPTEIELSHRLPASGQLDLEIPRLADGDWAMRAVLTDAAGNRSASAASTFSVAVPDPVAPRVAVDTQARSGILELEVEGPLDGLVTISLNGPGEHSVEIELDDAGRGSDEIAVVDGVWSVTGTATDWRGRTSAAFSVVKMIIDTRAPELGLVVDEALLGQGTVAWQITTEEGATIRLLVVRVSDGETIAELSNASGELADLKAGEYRISATVTDGYDNSAEHQLVVAVESPVGLVAILVTLMLLGLVGFGGWRVVRYARGRRSPAPTAP